MEVKGTNSSRGEIWKKQIYGSILVLEVDVYSFKHKNESSTFNWTNSRLQWKNKP